ncbi:MAG TPA: hypothetical protein VNQ77_15750 [Frankiaceae bacterium]|nr:hypothetical protein [Frankiaceae bacterium]
MDTASGVVGGTTVDLAWAGDRCPDDGDQASLSSPLVSGRNGDGDLWTRQTWRSAVNGAYTQDVTEDAVARVNEFIEVRGGSLPHPTVVDVRHQVVDTGGEKYLQITTFGSKFRETRPKPSQTLQFDKKAATRMIEILRATFPDLR